MKRRIVHRVARDSLQVVQRQEEGNNSLVPPRTCGVQRAVLKSKIGQIWISSALLHQILDEMKVVRQACKQKCCVGRGVSDVDIDVESIDKVPRDVEMTFAAGPM
eukprot:CAMPEP_0198126284 /NCGR_PEP_ID=MMETSP1442-20131203/44447_1 /TAXON_ID= /ORGANISM="Craspedostauros australis, Strain CCMP3328" /LENGTH=104 /DNA_ID=CAMNT_0043786037 /DNA_START=541 /DNA_END=855 /DNA_ORIENTATION=+